MQPIMIARVAHVLSFTDVLQASGTPLGHELSKARLPTMLETQPDAYVPVTPVLRFLQHMEHKEGIEDIGFLASRQHSFDRLSSDFIEMSKYLPTLYARLQLFAELAPLENSNCRIYLIREGNEFRVCNNLVGYPNLPGLRYSEWLQVAVLVDIVRKTVGSEWCPSEITFQSQFSPCESAYEKFPNTRFLFGQQNTSIKVSASLMSQRLRSEDRNNHDHNRQERQLASRLSQDQFELDFPGSLKLALRSYFQDDYPDVNLAAEIAGTSVRTLQRRLGQFGMNYSCLVQQARFETAVEMFKDPGTKILDVANAVGYSDPSHFARAFRSIAGISPQEYRRQRLDG